MDWEVVVGFESIISSSHSGCVRMEGHEGSKLCRWSKGKIETESEIDCPDPSCRSEPAKNSAEISAAPSNNQNVSEHANTFRSCQVSEKVVDAGRQSNKLRVPVAPIALVFCIRVSPLHRGQKIKAVYSYLEFSSTCSVKSTPKLSSISWHCFVHKNLRSGVLIL